MDYINKTGDGLIFIRRYQGEREINESINVGVAIRSKTDIELVREELAAVKEGQELQDGAIADLGAITSAVAEKLELGTQ